MRKLGILQVRCKLLIPNFLLFTSKLSLLLGTDTVCSCPSSNSLIVLLSGKSTCLYFQEVILWLSTLPSNFMNIVNLSPI